MLVEGKWLDNITCPKCRNRHPKEITCEQAKAIADKQREERELWEEQLLAECTDPNT